MNTTHTMMIRMTMTLKNMTMSMKMMITKSEYDEYEDYDDDEEDDVPYYQPKRDRLPS